LIIIDVQGSGQIFSLLLAYLNKLFDIRLKVNAVYFMIIFAETCFYFFIVKIDMGINNYFYHYSKCMNGKKKF